MGRIENKYLVPGNKLDEFRSDVLPYLNHDAFSDRRHDKIYTVRSIYLDSPDLTSYYEKSAGIKTRNKFRVRGYNELTQDSKVFVEIKRKENDFVSKDRTLVAYTDLYDFINNADLTKIQNHTAEYEQRLISAKNFFFYYMKNRLKPMINVVYEREAWECKFGSGLRVTFDMNIRSHPAQNYDTLFDEKDMKILFPSSFVLEIKYNKALPSWVPQIVNKYHLKKEAISKYALCMDLYLKNNSFHNLFH